MEASPRRSTATSPLGPAWDIVESWPADELSAEAKLAWQRIWLRAGMRFCTVRCHQAAIGQAGGGADPNRSGKRSLQALANQGLITLAGPPDRGQWTFFLNDPAEVRNLRLAKFAGEVQGDLFEEPTPVLAEEPPSVAFPVEARSKPAAVVPLPPKPVNSEGEGEISERNSVRSESEGEVFTGNGGSGATAAESDGIKLLRVKQELAELNRPPPDDPQALSEVLGPLKNRLLAASAAAPDRAQQIVERIKSVIGNDPKLSIPICEQVAWAIVEGIYPSRALHSILNKIAADARLKTPADRGKYFHSKIGWSFKDHRLELKTQKPPPTPTAKSREPPF